MRTSKPEYGSYIMDALRRLGEASLDDVLVEVYASMRDRLHPADLIVLPNSEPRWRNQATHMLDGLIEDGYIVEKKGLLSLSGS